MNNGLTLLVVAFLGVILLCASPQLLATHDTAKDSGARFQIVCANDNGTVSSSAVASPNAASSQKDGASKCYKLDTKYGTVTPLPSSPVVAAKTVAAAATTPQQH